MRNLSCCVLQKAAQRDENAYETTKTPRQINSAAFPWQRGAVIWRLVSHGCVSLPHRPPLCLTDGSCDCNHPSYCQRQKRARKGKSDTPSLSHSLVSRKQATPLWAEPTHGPQALCRDCVCVFWMCVPMLVWSTEGTCVGVHLWLSVSVHYAAWSVTGVYTGEPWTCLILQLIKSSRDLFPCGPANGPHINMSLFSRQEKQEGRDRQGRRRAGAWGKRQKQAGIAQMKGCIKGPEWNIWQWYITALISLLRWDNWMAKARSVFVCRCRAVRDPSIQAWQLSCRRSAELKKKKKPDISITCLLTSKSDVYSLHCWQHHDHTEDKEQHWKEDRKKQKHRKKEEKLQWSFCL